MKASEFEAKFETGEDITEDLDLARARRVNHVQRRINVDFPVWMIRSLSEEARRLGVSRQSLIKLWISERLDADSSGARTAPRS